MGKVYEAATPSLVEQVVAIFGSITLAAMEVSPALKNVPTVDGPTKTVPPAKQQRLFVKKVRNLKFET